MHDVPSPIHPGCTYSTASLTLPFGGDGSRSSTFACPVVLGTRESIIVGFAKERVSFSSPELILNAKDESRSVWGPLLKVERPHSTQLWGPYPCLRVARSRSVRRVPRGYVSFR